MLNQSNTEDPFRAAAANNLWGDPDSLSGTGSNLYQTRIIRKEIPKLIKEYKIKKMLDAPCGDFFWVSHMADELVENLDSYKGVDLVEELITKNRKKYTSQNMSFEKLNLIDDDIPKVDLIMTRDCFIHLSFNSILKILKNYKKSKSKYLLLSTYTSPYRNNTDISNKGLHFRALNMQKAPFYFPSPITIINEGCTEDNYAYTDKSLALWKIEDIDINKLSLKIWIFKLYTFLPNLISKMTNFLKKARRLF